MSAHSSGQVLRVWRELTVAQVLVGVIVYSEVQEVTDRHWYRWLGVYRQRYPSAFMSADWVSIQRGAIAACPAFELGLAQLFGRSSSQLYEIRTYSLPDTRRTLKHFMQVFPLCIDPVLHDALRKMASEFEAIAKAIARGR